MLDLIEEFDGSAAAQRHLMEGIDAHVASVNASRKRGDVSLVGRAEEEVRTAPRDRIRFDDRGDATVYAVGRTFAAVASRSRRSVRCAPGRWGHASEPGGRRRGSGSG